MCARRISQKVDLTTRIYNAFFVSMIWHQTSSKIWMHVFDSHMHIYIYVYIYIYTNTQTYIYTQAPKSYACMYIYTCTNIWFIIIYYQNSHTSDIYIYVYIDMCIYIYIWKIMYIYTHIFWSIHIYMCIIYVSSFYIYTYVYIYVHILFSLSEMSQERMKKQRISIYFKMTLLNEFASLEVEVTREAVMLERYPNILRKGMLFRWKRAARRQRWHLLPEHISKKYKEIPSWWQKRRGFLYIG